jgi:hypothetical protein
MSKVVVVTDGIQGPPGPPGPPGAGTDLFSIDDITDGDGVIWDAEISKFVPGAVDADAEIDGGFADFDFGDEIDGGSA